MKLLFKTKAPPDLKQYLGKKIRIDGKKIKITSIVGNITKPAFYEINGEHLIGMLRFHAQMLGDKTITEEQFLEFEKIQYHVEKMEKEKTQ
jgi:hypothetical protein